MTTTAAASSFRGGSCLNQVLSPKEASATTTTTAIATKQQPQRRQRLPAARGFGSFLSFKGSSIAYSKLCGGRGRRAGACESQVYHCLADCVWATSSMEKTILLLGFIYIVVEYYCNTRAAVLRQN